MASRDYLKLHIKKWGTDHEPHALHSSSGRGWREHGRTGLWFVYTMYESQERIKVPLYVGMTGHLHQRISQHRAQQDWWPLVGLIIVEKFTEKWDAEHEECQRIQKMRPLFNVAWNVHRPPLDDSTYAVML